MNKLAINRFFDRNLTRKPDYSQGFLPLWKNTPQKPPQKPLAYNLRDMSFSELAANGYALISIRRAGDTNIRESYYEIHRNNYPADGISVIKVKNKPADIVLKKKQLGIDTMMAYVYRYDSNNRKRLVLQSKRVIKLNIRK
jgi:hypothetical protein